MIGSGVIARSILAFVLVAAQAIQSVATASENSWLPLTRSDLLRLLSEANATTVTQTFDDWIVSQHSDKQLSEREVTRREAEKQRVAALLGSDEVSVISVATGPLYIFVAGNKDRIHTLRMTLPVVNYSRKDSDVILGFLSTLYRAAYPTWSDAGDWPSQSLKQAWDLKRIRAGGDPIVLHQQDGVTSATFGVPPDIVAYTITVREPCIPTKEQKGHFRRLIC